MEKNNETPNMQAQEKEEELEFFFYLKIGGRAAQLKLQKKIIF
jgi:hypothetical protein